MTLYVPFSPNRHAQWRVLEGMHLMGTFASRSDSLRFAMRLACNITRRNAGKVRLLVEEADGGWTRLSAEAFDMVDECVAAVEHG